MRHATSLAFAALALGAPMTVRAQQPAPTRPFGTLREQAARQQAWLQQRMTTVLPALMRKHGIDMWVVPMREYNEDPVFTSHRLPHHLRRPPPHHLRLLRHAAPPPAAPTRATGPASSASR